MTEYETPAITELGSLEEATQYGPPGPGGTLNKIYSSTPDYHYPAGAPTFNFS